MKSSTFLSWVVVLLLLSGCSTGYKERQQMFCGSTAVGAAMNQELYHLNQCRIAVGTKPGIIHAWAECYIDGAWKPVDIKNDQVVVSSKVTLGCEVKQYHNDVVAWVEKMYKDSWHEYMPEYE